MTEHTIIIQASTISHRNLDIEAENLVSEYSSIQLFNIFHFVAGGMINDHLSANFKFSSFLLYPTKLHILLILIICTDTKMAAIFKGSCNKHPAPRAVTSQEKVPTRVCVFSYSAVYVR